MVLIDACVAGEEMASDIDHVDDCGTDRNCDYCGYCDFSYAAFVGAEVGAEIGAEIGA